MKTTKDKKFKSNRFLPNLKHAIACLDGGDYTTGAEYLETAIALCGDDDGKKLCKMALNDARQEREEALRLCKMALNVVCYNSAEWCDDAELRDAGLELLAMGKPDKTSHTPAPWQADKWATGYTVSAPNSHYSVCHLADCNNAENNARLIAAAPELLAALENLIDDKSESNFVAARAAINKAKGGK
jgi:hypothetical protein